MKNKITKQEARELLEIGKRKLIECKTIKGKRAIRKTNKHLREIIKLTPYISNTSKRNNETFKRK